jgi:hypothetical protein
VEGGTGSRQRERGRRRRRKPDDSGQEAVAGSSWEKEEKKCKNDVRFEVKLL